MNTKLRLNMNIDKTIETRIQYKSVKIKCLTITIKLDSKFRFNNSEQCTVQKANRAMYNVDCTLYVQ